jgi:hypothetical protein
MQAGTLERTETRGQILLRKYQAAKGILLPRLSDQEEALFPQAVPEVPDVVKPGGKLNPCRVKFTNILYAFGTFL